MNKKSLSLLVSVLVSEAALAGHDGDNNLVIEINRGLPQLETVIRETTSGVKASPVSDGGELLQGITGVSAIRMGGRAMDPVIRGQKETQLNVLLDGGYIHGGCPNRMDPPTAYTSVDSYDRVTVIKGNRTVVYGGGGSGGTVLFERDWLEIPERGYTAELSGSYRENGDQWGVGADVAIGGEEGYLRFITHKGASGDYEDGAGTRIDSEYDSKSNALLGGIRLSENTTLEMSYEKADEEDVEFPGARMDSPYADAENSRIKLEHLFTQGALRQLDIELYRSDVIHLMDNSMMSSPSTSLTTGGRIVLDASLADIDWTIGVDQQKNDREAVAYMVSNGMAAFSQWPGVSLRQAGFFVEGEKALGQDDLLKMGLRYDRVKANASRASDSFGMMGAATPVNLYSAQYGTTDVSSTENNVGGFASWTHRLNHDYSLETTLSRSVRTADATERYVAKTDWIGNPQINPEKHHQIEAVLVRHGEALNWSLTGWYNRVDDYILRKSVAGVTGYSNVDAKLYGAEVEVSYPLHSNLILSSALAWVAGSNLDDGSDLSRISPLELTTALNYQQGQWKAGAEWKLVAAQNDVCLSSSSCGGQDVRQTPGYGIVNLNAEYAAQNGITVTAGVDNLFDKEYSLHESRDDAFDATPYQVTEPGQSVWVKVNSRF